MSLGDKGAVEKHVGLFLNYTGKHLSKVQENCNDNCTSSKMVNGKNTMKIQYNKLIKITK